MFGWIGIEKCRAENRTEIKVSEHGIDFVYNIATISPKEKIGTEFVSNRIWTGNRIKKWRIG